MNSDKVIETQTAPTLCLMIKEIFGKSVHLMLFQRFADLLTKPLLVSIPLVVTASELQALWEAGVDGVVVEVGVGQPAGRLKELRQVIDKIVFPSPRKRQKTEVLLPHIDERASVVASEEEEEEE